MLTTDADLAQRLAMLRVSVDVARTAMRMHRYVDALEALDAVAEGIPHICPIKPTTFPRQTVRLNRDIARALITNSSPAARR
jgi:hypothetical protein